jgi:antirestriction protein ArdC
MFDDLKALADKQAELHADRARLTAELEQARRPWWRRWFGA